MENKQGILVYARNNSQVDYVKQAVFLAERAKKYLDLPVSVVTDSPEYIDFNYPEAKNLFDRVIPMRFNSQSDEGSVLSPGEKHSTKSFYDGSLVCKRLEWKNNARSTAYDASPYEETLLLDSDIVISNSTWLECFRQKYNFLAYKNCVDLLDCKRRDDFRRISDTSVDFYWATAVFFRKTNENKIFFNLVRHVQENWRHYCRIFQINTPYFRNDYAFSIAIHIMNGYQTGDFVKPMPGTLYFATDKSILWEIDNDELVFLLEKPKYAGEYTALRTDSSTVHVLNKFSLNRCIDGR
jgi:hypothetical protein